jgi:hypothetical protein
MCYIGPNSITTTFAKQTAHHLKSMSLMPEPSFYKTSNNRLTAQSYAHDVTYTSRFNSDLFFLPSCAYLTQRKVKLSLYLIYHTMKTVRERRYSFKSRPLYSWGKSPTVCIGQETAWPSEPVWTLWGSKQSLPLPGIEPPGPVAQHVA